MKRLSILIYSLGGGGAERVVSILLKELQPYFQITLVLMNNKISYELPKNISIVYLESSNPNENGIIKLIKLPFLGWKYKKICKREKIDISLAFTNRPSYISIFSKIFGSKIKTVISERTTPSEIYKGNSSQAIISRFLIKTLYPKADMIITNSEGNYKDLVENFGIKLKQLITINNPIDIEKIIKNSQEKVDELEFENKFTFITLGRLDEGKNHILLINAFKELNIDDTQLFIYGEGPLQEQLQKKIDQHGLNEKVFLKGFECNPHKFLIHSDCFLFSSKYEGFPNVLVEALAMKLPIISTNCKSGPEEILARGKYGILVDVNNIEQMMNAMQEIYKNSNLRDKLINSAFKRAKYYDKIEIIDKIINELNKSL